MWYTVSIVIVQMLATVYTIISTHGTEIIRCCCCCLKSVQHKWTNIEKIEINIESEYIRIPDVPGGIFNAIYLVNLNSTIFFVWKLKMANWKFTSNNTSTEVCRPGACNIWMKTIMHCTSDRMCVHQAHMHVGTHINSRGIFIHTSNTICIHSWFVCIVHCTWYGMVKPIAVANPNGFQSNHKISECWYLKFMDRILTISSFIK